MGPTGGRTIGWDAVNRLEWTRRQLEDIEGALAFDSGTPPRSEDMFVVVDRPGGAEEFETGRTLCCRYLKLVQDLDDSASGLTARLPRSERFRRTA